jgi:hypothetical protein
MGCCGEQPQWRRPTQHDDGRAPDECSRRQLGRQSLHPCQAGHQVADSTGTSLSHLLHALAVRMRPRSVVGCWRALVRCAGGRGSRSGDSCGCPGLGGASPIILIGKPDPPEVDWRLPTEASRKAGQAFRTPSNSPALGLPTIAMANR